MSAWKRSNSAWVSRSSPALACSAALASVRLPSTAALPASSGWARIRASCSSGVGVVDDGHQIGMPVAGRRARIGARLHPGRMLEQGAHRATRPISRSRLTPPSGTMFSRTKRTGAEIGQAVAEDVDLVRLELHFGQQQRPALRSRGDLLGRAGRVGRRLEEAAVRIIAFEMGGVDDDLLDPPRRAQLQHRPVVPGLAPPPRLPAVAHVHAAPRRGEILDAAIMLVIGDDAAAAILHRQQVEARVRIDRRPVLGDPAPDAQPGDAAVGKDVEADMGDGLAMLDRARRRGRRRSARGAAVTFVQPASSSGTASSLRQTSISAPGG